MNKIFVVLFLFVALSWAAKNQVDQWWLKSKATVLKNSNFKDVIGKDKHVLVLFYGQFSKESEKFAPEWEKVVQMYKGEEAMRDDVEVAIMDGWTYATISAQYKVSGFPDLRFFRSADDVNAEKYTGELTAEKISEWTEKFINFEITADDANNTARPVDPLQGDDDDSSGDDAQEVKADEVPAAEPAVVADAPATPTPAADETAKAHEPEKASETPKTDEVASPKVESKTEEAKPVVNAPAFDVSQLNTQFNELKSHIETLTKALDVKMSEKFDSFKDSVESNKQHITNLATELTSHGSKIQEINDAVSRTKDELHKSVTSHVEGQVSKLGETINQIKIRAASSDPQPEVPQGVNYGQGAIFMAIGVAIGSIAACTCMSLQGNKRRKYLID